MTSTIQALNKFAIVDKPKDEKRYRGKYDELITAVKNVANDKAISIPVNFIGETKFENWLQGIKANAKKNFGIKIHAVLMNGSIQVFKRGA